MDLWVNPWLLCTRAKGLALLCEEGKLVGMMDSLIAISGLLYKRGSLKVSSSESKVVELGN